MPREFPAACARAALCYAALTPALARARNSYLKELAAKNAPAFLCHWYNVYFAHTAGGRMIGTKVAKDLLGGASLAFYEWEGDLATHMSTVRDSINAVAEGWSRADKDACLAETELSFKYSGELLRLIAGGPGH